MTSPPPANPCRWCGERTLSIVGHGAKARWFLEDPRDDTTSLLVRCSSCELVYFTATFTSAELANMYEGYRSASYVARRSRFEPWYTRRVNDGIGHASGVVAQRRGHLTGLIDAAVRSGRLAAPRRVLDFGGDEGQFIPALTSIEEAVVLEISGVRPAPGIRTITSWAEAAAFRPDFIMMCHVLEHTEHAADLVGSAFKALETGGSLYIEVPLDRPQRIAHLFARDAYRRYTAWLCRHPRWFVMADLASLVSRRIVGAPIPGSVLKQNEHINFFCELSLRAVVEAMGFEMLSKSVYSAVAGVPLLSGAALGMLFRKR